MPPSPPQKGFGRREKSAENAVSSRKNRFDAQRFESNACEFSNLSNRMESRDGIDYSRDSEELNSVGLESMNHIGG